MVLLGKGVLKICSKFTGEHPCQSAIVIKLQSNFIEVALRHGHSPVNLYIYYKASAKQICTSKQMNFLRECYFGGVKVFS